MQEDGELFPLRKLGVVPIVSPKDNKRLEQLKQIFTQNNTLTNDLEAFTQLWNSDTMTEVIHIAKESSKRANQQNQEKMQHEQSLVDKQIQAQQQQKMFEMANENDQKEKDRINKIEIEKIESLGRSVDNDADPAGLKFITDTGDQAIQKEKNDKENELKSKEVDNKIQTDAQTMQLKMKELGLRAQELKQRQRETEVKKYTSEINKN
jgi:hypothetical protein